MHTKIRRTNRNGGALAALALLTMFAGWAQAQPASNPAAYSRIESVIVNPVLLFTDPLTSAEKIPGQASKRVTGGEFTAHGWKTTANNDQLMIELAGGDGFDGALEIDLVGLDWVKANTSHNQDKIAFLSMFSNASGCPHATHGGSNMDALWMLRSGRKPDGTTFFGQGFKVYWSALGASQAEPSMYSEEEPVRFTRNEWAGWKKGTNTIRVHWSKEHYRFGVAINGEKIFEKPYEDQMRPFKYIFIGKSAEFDSLVGPTFSNLRVYGTRPGAGHTVAVPDVFISLPANGSFFDLGTAVPLMIAPRVEGIAFQKVEFFEGTEKIGDDATYPFALSWQPDRAGFYKLKISATDKDGKVFESPTKHVTIRAQTR